MKHKFIFFAASFITIYLLLSLLKDDTGVTYSWLTQQHIKSAREVVTPVLPELEKYFFDGNKRLPSSLQEVGLGHLENIPGNVHVAGLSVQRYALMVKLKDIESAKRTYFALVPQPTTTGLKWYCEIGKIDRQLFESEYPECLPPEYTIDDRLMEMVGVGAAVEVKKAAAKGADVNRISRGRFPLYLAIRNRSSGMVKLLLELGADINLVNHEDFGKTPLIYAIEKGDMKIIRILVEKGADVNAKDVDGETALDYVAKDDFELRKYLLDNGA